MLHFSEQLWYLNNSVPWAGLQFCK